MVTSLEEVLKELLKQSRRTMGESEPDLPVLIRDFRSRISKQSRPAVARPCRRKNYTLNDHLQKLQDNTGSSP